MKKLIGLLLVLALVFTGCTSAANAVVEPATAPAASAEAEAATPAATDSVLSEQLYIQVSALSSDPYFYDHQMGMEMAGKELGVRTEFVGPAELDMNAMVAAFEQAIAKQPNGIVVVGFDPQLEPAIKKATDAGIPVVTVDADLPNSTRIAFVGTGNISAGRMGGEKLAELIGGEGKVALVYQPGQSNLEERGQGYREALANHPGIEIVEHVDSKQDAVITAQSVAALLQKYPDLAGIACLDGVSGSGTATAVREAGLAGKLTIVTMDRNNEVLEGIEEGTISASIAQQTALMPYYATQILINLSNSKMAITTNNAAAGVLGVPNSIDTGVIVIDKENYEYYKR